MTSEELLDTFKKQYIKYLEDLGYTWQEKDMVILARELHKDGGVHCHVICWHGSKRDNGNKLSISWKKLDSFFEKHGNYDMQGGSDAQALEYLLKAGDCVSYPPTDVKELWQSKKGKHGGVFTALAGKHTVRVLHLLISV